MKIFDGNHKTQDSKNKNMLQHQFLMQNQNIEHEFFIRKISSNFFFNCLMLYLYCANELYDIF